VPSAVTVSLGAEVVTRHPDVLVGGFVAGGLREAARALEANPVEIDVGGDLAGRGLVLETLAADPVIADWRAAIALCGLKPSTFKSSPEQLARRTLKSGPVRTGLPLVDLYCDVATRHLAPLGAYDAARLPGTEVRLRLAEPGADTFAPLGGRDGDMPLADQVAVYAVGGTVVCWAYNCRDSRDTCLTADTDAGVFLGEAVTARQQQPLRDALAELAGHLAAAGAVVGQIAFAEASRTDATLA
jgi:DNA/RNA-binding domain of Phe-tRNA-synthetase-like protein